MDSLDRELLQGLSDLSGFLELPSVPPRCKFPRESLIGQGTATCQALASGRQDSCADDSKSAM